MLNELQDVRLFSEVKTFGSQMMLHMFIWHEQWRLLV